MGTDERGLWDYHLQTRDNPPLVGDKLNADCYPYPSSEKKLKRMEDEKLSTTCENLGGRMRTLPLKTTKESHGVAVLHNCDKIRLFAVEI